MTQPCLAVLIAVSLTPAALADSVAFGTLLANGVTTVKLANATNAPEIAFNLEFDGYQLSGTICDSNACGPGFGSAIPQVDLLNFSATCVAVAGCGEFTFHWGETLDTGVPFDPMSPVVIAAQIGGTFSLANMPIAPDIIYFGGRVNQGGLDAKGEIPANGFFGLGNFSPPPNTFSYTFGPQLGGPFTNKVDDLVFSLGWDLSPALDNTGDNLILPETFINVNVPVATPVPEPSSLVALLAGLTCFGLGRRCGFHSTSNEDSSKVLVGVLVDAQRKGIVRRDEMKRTINAQVLAGATAFVLGIVPAAQADDKGCSNATLKGTFGYTTTGFITAPPTLAGPFASVGTQTFDGKGATTARAMVSQNGNIVPVTIAGTYTVNPDCTGTFTLQISPVGITTHVFFVIDDSATVFRAIQTDPGVVVTGVARRQFSLGDWRQ